MKAAFKCPYPDCAITSDDPLDALSGVCPRCRRWAEDRNDSLRCAAAEITADLARVYTQFQRRLH